MRRPIARSTRTGLVTALCAGLLLTQGCAADPDGEPSVTPSVGPTTGASAGDPPATPSATTSSATTSSATTSSSATGSPPAAGGGGGDEAILRGERQVAIKPVPSFESILAVDEKGRLNLTDGGAEYALFVLDPVGGGRHQIKTASADRSGEPSCMGLRDNGNEPTTVMAAPCDTSAAGQLFTLERMRATDERGRPTYAIRGDKGVHLRATADSGLVARAAGGGGLDTAFAFVDNGEATLPELD
ncbi:hypothetical protein GA0074692_4548 [Micromonospora pallida]|uniref:Ricin B lectin domain-containing protein n=1 Tax=Micromonospora pallida TaxID=145854 RepID=A0A1C6T5H1_9ACTN|nr:hypothetical protein [Micromonospora pallida]SCL37086.1 hypothetical protein GA0074692_4548 [Micromonospora pallida]